MTDTVKEAGEDRRVTATLDRSRLWAIQTPQAFRRAALERALDVDAATLAAATDDAWLVERAGGTVRVVESTPENFKVTTPHDLRGRRAAAGRAARVTRGWRSWERPPGLLSGLLGIGGGIIIVPGLIWAAGLDRHTASGTSLVAILPIAAVAALTYAVAPGGAFDPEASAIFVLGSVTGAVLGARVNARVSERALRMAMAVLTLVFGLRLVIPLGFGAGKEDLPLDAVTVVLLLYLGAPGRLPRRAARRRRRRDRDRGDVAAIGTSQVLAQGIALVATIPTVIVGALAAPPPGHARAAPRARGRARRDGAGDPRRVPGVRAPRGGAAHGVRRLPADRQLPHVPGPAAPAGARRAAVTAPRHAGVPLVNRRSTRSR